MALVKCYHCGKKDTDKKDMYVHIHVSSSGREYPRNMHHDCVEKHLEEKKFKEKEAEEKDNLVEKMMEVHNIETIPPQFYPYIEELRNGTVLFGKRRKKYKQGFKYSLIEETYDYCRETITYWRRNKEFKNTMSELKYCWMIINDKIGTVKKLKEKKAHYKAVKQEQEKTMEDNNDIQTESNVKYNYNNNRSINRSDDISDLL